MVYPIPARGDGGPIVDPEVFAKLKEGQQVAVITLHDTSTASIDLFVSILDQTGESHEVVFFIPLGMKASGFSVQEQNSLAFNDTMTNRLDVALFQDYRRNQEFMINLFAGALLTNGIWLTPLWLPFLLTGCQAVPPPVSTYQTDSSQVSIFNIDENTDVESLISATGLDPSVTDTLYRMKGQQIAIVKLHTQAQEAVEPSDVESSTGEPGLHLSWSTSLVQVESGATYAYPLGTGAAWAHPIEITRVYIVAPPELEVVVQYPKLGVNRSGYTREQWYYEPRIASSSQVPAYAVDTAIDQSPYPLRGPLNIWRITYASSNAAEDILVTVKESSGIGFGLTLRRTGPQVALIIGLIIAALFWILAWYFLMPRLLDRHHKIRGLWRFSLTYLGWNLLLLLPGGFIIYIIFSFGQQALALGILAVLFGGASVLIFNVRHLHKMGVSTTRAIRAFIIVTLASNGAYLLFVFGYARLVSAV